MPTPSTLISAQAESRNTAIIVFSSGSKSMLGITRSSDVGKNESSTQTFITEQRLQQGAENAVRCMGVSAQDRVFILTDYACESIARRVSDVVMELHADVTVRFLEHYGERPLTTFPGDLREYLLQARPTVTYYIAT